MSTFRKIVVVFLMGALLFNFTGCLNAETDDSESSLIYSTNNTSEETPPSIENEIDEPKKTLSPTPKPTKKPAIHTEEPSNSSELVWIPTKGGKKYHSKSTCSNMNNPKEVTKTIAESKGFSPCKKCYK